MLENKDQTIDQVIEALDSQYPGFRKRICGEDRKLRRFIHNYLDGEDIRFLDHLSTTVRDRFEVAIVLAVSGG